MSNKRVVIVTRPRTGGMRLAAAIAYPATAIGRAVIAAENKARRAIAEGMNPSDYSKLEARVIAYDLSTQLRGAPTTILDYNDNSNNGNRKLRKHDHLIRSRTRRWNSES